MREYFKFVKKYFLFNKKIYLMYNLLLIIYLMIEILFPVVTGKFIDLLVQKKSFNSIIIILLLVAIIGFINQVIKAMKMIYYNKYSECTKNEIRLKVLDIVRKSKYEDLNLINASSFTQRLNLDLSQIISFIMDDFVMFFLKIIQFIILLIYIFSLDFFLGFLTLFFLPIYFFVYYFFKKKIYISANKVKKATSDYYEKFHFQINNIDDIIHIGNYKIENKKFNISFFNYFDIIKDYIGINWRFDFVQGLVALMLNVIMFLICAKRIVDGSMHVGTLTVLMSFFTMLLSNIGYGFEFGKNYQLFCASADKIMAIFRLKQIKEGEIQLYDKIEDIKVSITFGYNQKLLYKNLELKLSKNNVYGILGYNGKGKSTLYKILTGIIKSDNSIIKINSIDINKLDSVYFRNTHVAFVKQIPLIFDLKLSEYLLEKTNSNNLDEINQKLNMKNIYSDIIGVFLRNKWDSNMMELSGGDVKTIYLIESFLVEKELKIYDEPTTNLDSDRKKWFINSIDKVINNNIIIIITHDDELYNKFNKTLTLDKDISI